GADAGGARGPGSAPRFRPGRLPFLDEEARRDGGEEFRVGRDLVERARRERQLRAVVAVAVPLREDEPVADDDPDADSRDVPVFERLAYPRVEVLQLRGRGGVRRLGGRKSPGDREGQEDEGESSLRERDHDDASLVEFFFRTTARRPSRGSGGTRLHLRSRSWGSWSTTS